MARPSDKHIKILVKTTEEFITDKLLPKMEELGLTENAIEIKSCAAATLQATGAAIGNGVIRLRKKGDKYSSFNSEFDNEPEEEEEEDFDPDQELSDATKNLFELCIKLGRDKKEKRANVAAVAATILMAGRDNFGEEWFKKAILTAIHP